MLKRDFVLLNIANFISQFGDRFTHLVIIHFVGEVSPGSFFAFSKASLFFALPVVVFGPFAGVFVDRFYKKNLMLLGDIVRFLLVFSLPFLIRFTGVNTTWFIIFIVFTFNLIFNSARYSIIPDIVGVENSIYANSSLTFFARIAAVLGTVMGGFIVERVGWRYGFQIDGLTYLFSFLLILFIVEKGKRKRGKFDLKGYLLDLKEGFQISITDRVIRFVMVSVYMLMFISSIGYSIVIKYVQQDLNLGTEGVSIVGGISAAGMILGALITGTRGKFNRYVYVSISFILTSLLILVAPLYRTPVSISLIMFFAGLLLSIISISCETLIHENVEPTVRGRVFTFKDVMASISFIVNTLITGLLADTLGFGTIMVASSLFILVVTILNILSHSGGKLRLRSPQG